MDEDDRTMLRGVARLAVEGTRGAAEVVESMHARISPLGGRHGAGGRSRARGVSGFVYGAVRATAGGAGGLLGRALGIWPKGARHARSAPALALRSALNGVTGDHLAAVANPLALRMSLRSAGRPLTLEREALRAGVPDAGGRLLVLVHGLCMNDLQWRRRGHDHGAALAAELGCTPLYLRYNSGLPISRNGRALAALLERLLDEWPHPVTEVTLLCHSMGGLVARAACHHAAREGLRWPASLRRLVFLGTPHHGSPLERGGNRLHRALAATRITAPLARLGALRSAGITDLRFGGDAIDIEGEGEDRFAARAPRADAVPLPAGVACFSIAATLGRRDGDLRDRLLGDGLVPVRSALGRGAEGFGADPDREWIGYGMGHMDLLSHPAVYRRLRDWLST